MALDENEQVVLQRKLRRREFLVFFGKLEPCLVGLEACCASHYWARELQELGHGEAVAAPVREGLRGALARTMRWMPGDLQAMWGRPRCCFVPIKSAEQMAAQMMMSVRESCPAAAVEQCDPQPRR